jgi:hypothetical protein
MQGTDHLTAGGCSAIFGRMLREAIIAERDRRGWNNNQLAKASGVPYGRLHEWLHQPGKRIHSEHIERLMDTLKLRVCRGSSRK